ncbi:hypothetical protein [Bacillus litorisediminis]|uniref:hypothetical protein n=1 Tax=Bacillus litorisediminis TaxID=2922713 RepID=UPI001FAC55FD|nr:hypothetical protein [Bacillus litorisediminis]
MTIETQLEVIKKALESGGRVEIYFFDMEGPEQAETVAKEYANPLEQEVENWESEFCGGTRTSEIITPVRIHTFYNIKEEQNETTHDVPF